ncbi:MAG TPA: TIGR03621 family F420-dependent LLM class oxidoreductase [Actinocrinis sp.]|jgi:probable F420-dependent oxidoreductase
MHDYRFGFNLRAVRSPAALRETCRTAERFGYDVVLCPDHLGRDRPSPFPVLTAAAGASERMRVGTFVLNIGFWNPSLLARDAAATDVLSGGRLELGLGLGHMKAEFDAAGLPWQPIAERADRLEATLDELDRLLGPDAPDGYTTAQKPRPPLMLAGSGDRLLAMAARRADIVGLTGLWQAKGEAPGSFRIGTAQELDRRVAFLREQAGDRAGDIEINMLIQSVVVTDDRRGAARKAIAEFELDLTPEQLLDDVPVVLIGTQREIAEQIAERRERFGVTYFSVHEPYMAAFGPVIELLRG